MPPVSILLDENIPEKVALWLREIKPQWKVWHVHELSLTGQPDETLFLWAQSHAAIIVIYDEDFSDSRFLNNKVHCGIIRLRVYPTTIEQRNGR